MYEVDDLFEGAECRTRLWVSEKVKSAIVKHARKDRKRGEALRKTLVRYVTNGFGLYEGGAGETIKPEGQEVYRIGMHRDLFRIIGFYENDATKADFIAIAAFIKDGKKLNASQRAIIDRVADVKRQQVWKRR